MSWKDAAKKVLEEAGEPLHYTDITERILDQGLKINFGATPAATVNATINAAIKTEGSAGVFERTEPGEYGLRTWGKPSLKPDDDADSGSLEAFGMYWQRNDVYWASKPRLLGRTHPKADRVDLAGQQGVVVLPAALPRHDVYWASKPRLLGRTHPKADRVDLAGQQGVYLLYDENGVVVYVGQATKQSIGQRLAQHTKDRLRGRWQRFSWFGIRPVDEDGRLGLVAAGTITPARLTSTLEALLIEALEPRQNRAGSSYSGIEYLQVTDPKL